MRIALAVSGTMVPGPMQPTVPQPPPMIVSVTEGEPSIDNATGSITVTVTGGIYAGVYTQDIAGNPLTAALVTANRTVCIARPQITGTPGPGETLGAANGLWLYDGGLAAPVFSYQWLRNGLVIPGATGAAHVITAADQGTALTLAVTASQDMTAITASSLPAAIPPAAGAFGASHAGGVTSGTPAGDPTVLSLPTGAAHPDRWIVVMIHAFLRGTATDKIGAITLDGIACAILVQSGGSGSENRVTLAVMTQAKLASGTTATLTIDWVDGFHPNNSIAVRAESYRLIASAAPLLADTDATSGTALSLDTEVGDVLIAGAMSQNQIDPSGTWTGAAHRNSVDLATGEWASVADDLSVAAAATGRSVGNTIAARYAGLVLRQAQ